MQVSARILGEEYDLTAEEMNRVLVKQGFLQGAPGDYIPTQKGLPYIQEKDYHRGMGGYSCYNKYWTTRTFDDSIKEELNVSAELIREVRSEIDLERAARYAKQRAARKQADADFLAKQVAKLEMQEAEEKAVKDAEECIAKLKKTGKIGLIVAGVIIVSYGIYKAIPKVKSWWKEHKHGPNEQSKAA